MFMCCRSRVSIYCHVFPDMSVTQNLTVLCKQWNMLRVWDGQLANKNTHHSWTGRGSRGGMIWIHFQWFWVCKNVRKTHRFPLTSGEKYWWLKCAALFYLQICQIWECFRINHLIYFFIKKQLMSNIVSFNRSCSDMHNESAELSGVL